MNHRMQGALARAVLILALGVMGLTACAYAGGFGPAQGSGSGGVSSSALDAAFGSTRGAILYRSASGWTKLDPGTSGHVLTSNGTGADPSYQAGGGVDVSALEEGIGWTTGLGDITHLGGPDNSNLNVEAGFDGNLNLMAPTGGVIVRGNEIHVSKPDGTPTVVYLEEANDDGPSVRVGAGSPEGAVVAVVGSIYLRTDGETGTTLYVKESGTGNTGWVAK